LRFELLSEGRALRNAGIRPGYAKSQREKERREIRSAGKKHRKTPHKK
jgi:hypothetical protein